MRAFLDLLAQELEMIPIHAAPLEDRHLSLSIRSCVPASDRAPVRLLHRGGMEQWLRQDVDLVETEGYR
jgi:hypothetical protein